MRKVWSAGDQLNATDLNGNFAFGGSGADGALSISSGTTTLSVSNAAVFQKNYTSISITGTGKLAFSNPHVNGTVIVLKSQGSVTITSSTVPCIDSSAFGAAGALGSSASGPRSGATGNNGNAYFIFRTNGGGGGDGTTNPGIAGALPTLAPATLANAVIAKYGGGLWVGAGGGSGGQSNGSTGTTGNGGIGGGCLVIECGGSWNFTTSGGISVAGANGTNATTHGGAGGGGAGGFCKVLYGSLTANSGTITVVGGSGGTNISETGANGGGGAGNGISAGNAGTSGAGSAGAGATGTSSVEADTDYA